MTQAYPLQWPNGRRRTADRKRASFSKKVRRAGRNYDEQERLTIADALSRLQAEVDRLGAREYVLSTNLQVRLDGLPRSGQAEPPDPGVALYFHLDGKPHCLPCDTYDRAADNIAAIAKHIEATRAIERYGVASLSEMFAGFTALPAPGQEARRSWRRVFDRPEDWVGGASDIEVRYRELAKERHPDRGGTAEMMSELNAARAEALQEVS